MSVCICETDPDGHCNDCREIIRGALKQFGDALQEYQQKVSSLARIFGSGGCDECGRRYADWASAKLLEESAKTEAPKDFLDAAFNSITHMLMGLGVTAFPLTLKSYKEICWSKGWDEDSLFDL